MAADAMRLLRLLHLLIILVLVAGMVLHLTVADSWSPGRVLFYALPLPVISLGWLAMAFVGGPGRFFGNLCLVAALGCGAWWVRASYREPAPAATEAGPLKVLFWNMAHKKLPSASLQTLLETFAPDIAGMVEVGSRHSDPSPLVATLPAGYTVQKLDHGMSIVVRGSVKVVQQTILKSKSKFAVLEATVDGATWRVFIVDGASRPTTPRADVLARVLQEARAHPRTVIMGDFNTPSESALFHPWRAEFRHAFDDSGRGFRETWPRYIPVLTIDHVWSSKDAPPLRTVKRWLTASDHAALLVELAK